MLIKHGYYTLTAIALAAFSPLANSTAPVCGQASHNSYSGEFDGRFYQVVVASGVTWDAARAAAELLENDGVQGQLATINSFAEDEYIHCLINAREDASDGPTNREYWVGGFQEECGVELPDEVRVGCGWQWINGEPINPTNTLSPYTNWQNNEPNDNFGPGSEQHLGVNLGGNFGWNDEFALGNIGGFVVEFGDALAPVAATECTSASGCPLGDEEVSQTMFYPAGTQTAPGQFVLPTTFTVDIACDGVGPKLFFDGAVEVPAYLCGNNVVFTHILSPVDVLRDIVVFENQEDGEFGCANPPADWTQQDVIGYSTSDPTDMFEHGITTGFDSRAIGSHHDFVIGCRNPPRGAGGKGSWISRGLEFDPSVDDTFRHELTAYKLYATRLAVVAAKPFLKKAEWLALLVPIDAAIYLHGKGKEKLALASVKLLVALNDKVKYRVAGPLEEPRNPHGEVKFRGLNAADMIDRRTLREGTSP